ncbi:hypothetical protein KKA66_00950 [Patescibacteria group bacterium]|nr:hypothetical protein [Patescibacteria group bacterium]
MKKLQYILILSLLLVPVSWANAAGSGNIVSNTADTNITLSSPSMTLVLGSGSTFYSMEVGASTITFIVSPGGKVTLTSSDRYRLNPDTSVGMTSYCNSTQSQVIYNKASVETADSTIIFTPTATACDSTSSGSSSSGSGQGGTGTSGGNATDKTAPAGTKSISKTVSGSGGGSTATTDNRASMSLPTDLASGNISMNIEPKDSNDYTAPASGYSAAGQQVYDFNLTVGGEDLSEFSKKVTLTFQYTNDDIKDIEESTLKVYYRDNGKWISLGGTLDKANNKITVEVNHFTIFGIFGSSAIAGIENLVAGDLIKTSDRSAVYYLGTDNKRYIFTTESTYKSWYADFSAVKTIAQADMDKLDEFGGNVTFRPGTWLIKFPTVPNVYAVEQGGVLRHIASEAIAKSLYGAEWWKWVKEVAEENYMSYTVGNDITEAKHSSGALIKYAGSNNIYYVSGSLKRVLTGNALNENNFKQLFVIETNIEYDDGAEVAGFEPVLKTTAGP